MLTLAIAIKCDNVKVIYVPYYESLTVELITLEALKYPEIEPYWPHERDLPRINRGWLCNMINTVVGPRFGMWVTENVKDRNAKLSIDRNMDLKLDPEVAKIFSTSTSVSSKYISQFHLIRMLITLLINFIATKGSAVNLMKPNVQRRRSKA